MLILHKYKSSHEHNKGIQKSTCNLSSIINSSRKGHVFFLYKCEIDNTCDKVRVLASS